MNWNVYVLRSLKDGKLYTGRAMNVHHRLRSHNEGKVPSTRTRRPFVLVYTEVFESEKEAADRERYLKTGFGRKWLKRRLAEGATPPATAWLGGGESAPEGWRRSAPRPSRFGKQK